jgi:pimeloyl-ACP methyl ester carboxylesterase
MATATIDGILTYYEVSGSGPPLLMFSPGGFDATAEKWATLGIYARTKPLDHLVRDFTCIRFDRRECGKSGGRIERIGWTQYAAQGKGLLDQLKIESAHLMGGCMGCSPVLNFAMEYPGAVRSMVLYWPVGGAKYRISAHQRFSDHLEFVSANGLAAVVALVRESGKSFSGDPRGGPWASVIKSDPAFAASYANFDSDSYKLLAVEMVQRLFDRDTAPGAEPEDLLRCQVPTLVIPGNDASHATSAARYLAECLPASRYWDVNAASQDEEGTAGQLLSFLRAV